MARQGKTLPARRPSAFDDSLLVRSAESLGRVIGSLQRQLDAARHMVISPYGIGDAGGNGQGPSRKRVAVAASKTRQKTNAASSGPKVRGTANRTSKRAVKSAAAKKTGARNRSGAKQRAVGARRRA